MNWAALLLTFSLSQAGNGGATWDKISSSLWARVQADDYEDRVRAVREAISTQDSKAFEWLAKALHWAREQKKALKEKGEERKKNLTELRENHSRKSKERDALLNKKKLGSGDSERLQSLNAEIDSLNQLIQLHKKAIEEVKAETANFEQVEALTQEGFATLLRGCAPGLYERYRKALAGALNFPGALQHGEIYVAALVQSGRKEGYPFLVEILKAAQGSESLFLATAKAMTSLGGREALESLVGFLAFPNSSVRKAAHEALKAATGQVFPAEKSAWDKWLREH